MRKSGFLFWFFLLLVYVCGSLGSTTSWAEGVSLENVAEVVRAIGSESPLVKIVSMNALLRILSSEERITLSRGMKKIIEDELFKNVNRRTILLAGLAEVESLNEVSLHLLKKPLREIEDPRVYRRNEWTISLILARNGDRRSIADLLECAKRLDFHTQAVFVLRDMQYIPQPEIVDYLKEFLYSDERLAETTPGIQGIPGASYAIAPLSMILQGFPVIFKEDFSYTEEEINICRTWMSSRTNLEFRSERSR